jgi:hypothetical protein
MDRKHAYDGKVGPGLCVGQHPLEGPLGLK